MHPKKDGKKRMAALTKGGPHKVVWKKSFQDWGLH